MMFAVLVYLPQLRAPILAFSVLPQLRAPFLPFSYLPHLCAPFLASSVLPQLRAPILAFSVLPQLRAPFTAMAEAERHFSFSSTRLHGAQAYPTGAPKNAVPTRWKAFSG
jgi:hypothetical protein